MTNNEKKTKHIIKEGNPYFKDNSELFDELVDCILKNQHSYHFSLNKNEKNDSMVFKI